MDVAGLSGWLEGYGGAWEAGDPEAAAGLFTDDATYRETPFEEPMRGSAGHLELLGGGPPDPAGRALRLRGAGGGGEPRGGRWWASFVRVPGGVRVDLDGIFVLMFDQDGQCTSLEEWWHGREEPPR